jgi:hypothetical protein
MEVNENQPKRSKQRQWMARRRETSMKSFVPAWKIIRSLQKNKVDQIFVMLKEGINLPDSQAAVVEQSRCEELGPSSMNTQTHLAYSG